MGLFSPGKMRFFSPRKKKVVEEEEEPVSASPLGDASTHAAYAAYKSSFPRRDRHEIAPVVLHVAVASPAPPSPTRAEASRAVGASASDERRDRDAESDARWEAGLDARETRRHGQSEDADAFVSTSAPRDAEGIDDTAKRLRAEVFPRSLLSCAVADREKGWIFPSASLWARNPSATHALRFRVQAMRHEEVYVEPNRGVLRPGGCLELRVTPRPVVDLAEDPDTVEDGDAPPEPNALALVTVAATRESADATDDEPFSRDDDVDPGLDADAVRTVVEMVFDVTAARECARAVAALEHAAELEATNAGTPSEAGSEDEDAAAAAAAAAAAELAAARAETSRALEECSRARREADAHAAAAATASEAAGSAAERLARREAEWEAEKATFVSEARRVALEKEKDSERLETRVAEELAKRRKVLDAVLDAMRARAESAETRASETAESLNEALKRSAQLEAELKLDRETFARRLQSSRAARDFALSKFGSAARTSFARVFFASWRRIAAAAADSRRALETERLARDRESFAVERASLTASLEETRRERDAFAEEARRARERSDRDEAGAARGLRELAEKQRGDIETLMRSVSAAIAANGEKLERLGFGVRPENISEDVTAYRGAPESARRFLAEHAARAEYPKSPRLETRATDATPPRDASLGFASLGDVFSYPKGAPFSFDENGDHAESGMTRRVDVEVVVDVDASGGKARVVSESVRRVRRVSPGSLFARTRDAHQNTNAVARNTSYIVKDVVCADDHAGDASDAASRSARRREAAPSRGAPRRLKLDDAEKTLEARLRVAGDAARRAREPWRPPSGWSP